MTRDAADGKATSGSAGWYAAWALLVAVALLSRFVGLERRVMGHDESMHAYYSLEVASGEPHRHDPALHGPLLYHLNGALFWAVGANDFTARITPAAAGVGLVVALFFFTPYLGSCGAFAAATLVTISPSLLFYGRYLRNDVYVELLALLWLWSLLRYLEDRGRDRLVLFTVAMGLSFAAKETSFVLATIVGLFLMARCILRSRHSRQPLRRDPSWDLAGLLLVMLLPFAAPLLHLALGWDPTDFASPSGLRRAATAMAIAFAASFALAISWFPRRAAADGGCARADAFRLQLLFWSMQLVLFSSFLRNLPSGFTSGVVGSLGYWLPQHEVARGSQPWFYYPMLAGLYDALPLLLSLGAALAIGLCAIRRRRVSVEEPAVAGTGLRSLFLRYCLWWWLASWLAFSFAGEKMPWLLTHLTLPACLLGGWWIGSVAEAIDWKGMPVRRTGLLLATPTLLAIFALRLLLEEPFTGRDLEAVAESGRWLAGLLGTAALGIAVVMTARCVGLRQSGRLVGIGAAAALAVLTIRIAAMASYDDPDSASEPLVYAAGSPDVRSLLDEIALLDRRASPAAGVSVAYGDETAWPMSWYFRDRPNTTFYGTAPGPDLGHADVVLVGTAVSRRAWPHLAREFVKAEYGLIRWPNEGYKEMSPARLWRELAKVEERRRLLLVLWHRDYGVDREPRPLEKSFELWVRRDVLAAAWGPLPSTPVAVASSPVSSAPIPVRAAQISRCLGGTSQELRQPTGLSTTLDGALVIADTGNHRLLVVEPEGAVRAAFGSRCDLSTATGCTDPDGDGPLRAGDGQFLEPWAVLATADEIAVADTWNGRIQVFDASGRFLRTWGRHAPRSQQPGPHEFYGPRGLALATGGNLLVTDTGHDRILLFTAKGELIDSLDREELPRESLDEPVGVTVGKAGTIYVADTWRRRIRILDARLHLIASWPVPGWTGRGALDKPYLAVAGDGRVYATDPAASRILVFTDDGSVEQAIDLEGDGDAPFLPTGITFDRLGEGLWVSDTANHRVCLLQ